MGHGIGYVWIAKLESDLSDTARKRDKFLLRENKSILKGKGNGDCLLKTKRSSLRPSDWGRSLNI